MPNWLKQHLTKKRAVRFGVFAMALILFFGYRAYSKPNAVTKYVVAEPERGLLIVSLSGTGQVSGEHQIDVKPSVSANVIKIVATEGQALKKDDPIVELDRHDALNVVRDASQNVRDSNVQYQSAKLSMEKLKLPATASALLQAQDAVNQAKRNLDKLLAPPNAFDVQNAESQITSAEQNAQISSDGKTVIGVRNAYDTMTITLKNTVLSLQKILSDADNIVAVDNPNANQNFVKLMLDQSSVMGAVQDYSAAKAAYTAAKKQTDALPDKNADAEQIDLATESVRSALNETATLLNHIYTALLATITSSNFSQSSLDSLKSGIQSDRTDITSKLSSITTQTQTIVQAKNSALSAASSLLQAQIALKKLQQKPEQRDVDAATETIKEKEQALADLKAGPTAMDLALAQNTVDQRGASLLAAQHKLADANEALKNYTVRAPFDGVLAKMLVQVTDNASSGGGVATMIATQQIATISLNEIDATKVKSGQKVTLTFDAIDGLTISGDVMDIATLGTVTQGVVNYEVKIGFDTQDVRVKPGMSVGASIITEMKSDVLMVPNAAVKTQGNQQIVEILDQMTTSTDPADGTASAFVTGTPRRQIVETGLVNDTNTEIVNGLSGTESIITQTIAPASAQAAAATNSGIRIPGLGGGAGGGGTSFRGAGAGGR